MKSTSSQALLRAAPETLDIAAAIQWMRKSIPMIAEWRERRHYRAELRRLLKVGPYMIDDIGLAHREALQESEKPFWRT